MITKDINNILFNILFKMNIWEHKIIDACDIECIDDTT